MTTIYLIRHGTTDANVSGRFQGRSDFPLNKTGLCQGECLAARFAGTALDGVYTSPLSRARETARFIGRAAGLVPQSLEGLTEVDGGLLEGRSRAENQRDYPAVMESMYHAPGRFAAPGGEDMPALQRRICDAMERLVSANPGRTLAVVSHGFVMLAYLHFLMGTPADEMKGFLVGNASVTTIFYSDSVRGEIREFGDESHLPPELRFRRAAGFSEESASQRPLPIG